MSYSKRPFEIKGDLINKRSRIKELINIESNSRDDRICYEIAEILKEISILFRYYGTGQLEEISKFFGFQKLEPGDTVTIEDFSFFIVHFGRVAIYEQGSKTKEFVQDCHFGYWDITSEDYVIRSIDYSEVIVLEKKYWDEIINNREQKLTHEKLQFFKTVEFFEDTSSSVMSQIAKFSYLKKLLPNTILVKQGECAKGIYIIHTGQVKLIRKTEQNTRILTLGELVKSDVCCDASFLKNEPCHYTAICILPLIAYYIDKDDLKKIDKNTVYDLSKLCKKFPSDAELQQDYSDKKKWSSFQKRLILDFKREKMQEKGFSNHLRGSVKLKKKKIVDEEISILPLISPRRSTQLNLKKIRQMSSLV